MMNPIALPHAPVRDPVCGMQITRFDAVFSYTRGGLTFFFCSPVCAERFEAGTSQQSKAHPKQL